MKISDKFKKIKISNEPRETNMKLSNILMVLFIIGILLIPFDNLPYFKSILGELSFKGSVYPFIFIILIVIYMMIKNRTLYFNKSKESILLGIFILWTVISIVFNFPEIMDNSLKGRSGISKLVLQLMVCSFMVMIAYTTDFIIALRRITLKDIRKFILISLIPVYLYGTIELIHLSGLLDMTSILEWLSNLLQTYHRGAVYTKGIRTVTGEVSYFAMYASFVLPWIASYIFTEREKIKKIIFSGITVYLLVLMIFSKSRAAYGILFVQLFIFAVFILAYKVNVAKKIMLIRAISITIISFLIVNCTIFSNIGGDVNSVSSISVKSLVNSLMDPNNMSNVARMGMQGSAFKMGLDNKIVGVGLGQFGFNAEDYLSKKALTSREVQFWINPNSTEGWPPAFSIFSRIVAELGIVGALIWISLIGYIILKYMKVLYKKEDDILGIVLVVSFIGVIISWWNADTFGLVTFWVLLPFVVRFNNQELIEYESDEV
ncbi:MAG: O-antigen ligase family protein [Sarcina sp.]